MAAHRRKSSDAKKQVALGQSTQTAPSKKPRCKINYTRLIVGVVLVLVIALVVAFLAVTVADLYRRYIADKEREVSVDLTSHTQTPATLQSKVAYYVFGMFGETEQESLDGLAVLCHDKNRGTLQVLQLPQATYLGETEDLATAYFADIWGKPQPLDWCKTCRRQVVEDEIGENGRHTECCCFAEVHVFCPPCKMFCA